MTATSMRTIIEARITHFILLDCIGVIAHTLAARADSKESIPALAVPVRTFADAHFRRFLEALAKTAVATKDRLLRAGSLF